MNAINQELNFIITGSNGWISRNFISQIIKNYPTANIHEINRKNRLENSFLATNLANNSIISYYYIIKILDHNGNNK